MVAKFKGFDLSKMKVPLLPVALAISSVVWLVLSVPQFMKMSSASAEVVNKKKLLAELDAGIQNFGQLEKEFSSLQKANRELHSKLPPLSEFPVILELVSSLAKRNNIKIISLEPQKAVMHESQMYTIVPLFIDAYCSYHDLGRFVNALEYAPKFFKIQNFTITGAEADPKTQQVIMTVQTFCRNEDK